MKKKRILAACAVVMALAMALMAMISCAPQEQKSSSSSSSESLVANEKTMEAQSAASKEPYYVLVVGDDSRVGTVEITKEQYADGTGRSDTIMLARVDPSTYQITLVTLPRDTEDSINGNPVKINERYRTGGIDDLMNAVEGLTGVRPKYYLTTTFVGFEDLVNALGGVDIYVPMDQSMTDIVSGNQISYSAGQQVLDGPEALVYARERKKYNDLSSIGGEPYRQSNDRMIVKTMITNILSNADTAQATTTALLPFVKTNWANDDLMATVKDFADNSSKVTFLDGSGPYEGYTNDTAGWVATRDEATWKKLIEVVNSGGDPRTVVPVLSLYD